MRFVVTGAAGFIGSHLCEELLRRGHDVAGIDSFIPYYPPAIKQRNLADAQNHPQFEFHSFDLRRDRLEPALDGADAVFHLAGMPGLNASWVDFDGYLTCNVQATQRLLEAMTNAGSARLIYASTSSVYGEFARGNESLPVRPISPYGVTKYAGEQLCQAYAAAKRVHVVIARYFSVYGPRQRPDMGYYRFIQAMLQDQPITVSGDGQQVRGNTFIDDCVDATIRAADGFNGAIYNIGGGEPANVWDVLRKLENISGIRPRIQVQPARPGDQRFTMADTSRMAADFGWAPRVSLDQGLARQWAWQSNQDLESRLSPNFTGPVCAVKAL